LLRSTITTPKGGHGYMRNMPAVTAIHRSKQPRRPHYIPEWTERRNLSQADLGRKLGADKSVVSRWFKGATPGEPYQNRLAALFGIDREALFRHPDDDWFAQMFAGRRADEIEAMKRTLEAAFPRKRA
jgi:transcriptional regulator with XRE-family HTH domain